MQLAMIGLGRMGGNMVRRLMRNGHDCVVYARRAESLRPFEEEGATGVTTYEDLVAALEPPRAVWIMVPAAVVGSVVDDLAAHLEPGDVLIDGGNSYYRDDVVHAEQLRAKGMHFIDVGTSGGVFGLERGYCLMIGGEAEAVERLDSVFRSLAPGVDAAPRTTDGATDPRPAEYGYLHCGPSGAGHFVKMVHNGIEYGLMASYAEGLNILRRANVGNEEQETSAEITPLREREFYRYDLDLAAIEEGVPAPVLATALSERFSSRGEADYANRLLSAMRRQFGGHAELAGKGGS